MRIFLIRHCESEANVDVKARARYEDCNIPLTKAGEESRKALGQALHDALGEKCSQVKLFHSPYLRIKQTLEGALPELGGRTICIDGNPAYPKDKTLTGDDTLTDMHKGSYWPFSHQQRVEIWGESYNEYKRIREYGTSRQKYTIGAPNGESLKDVVARMRTFADKLKDKCGPDDDIIIVGHDATLSALRMVLMNVPEVQIAEQIQKELHPHNASIRLLEGKSWDALNDKKYIYSGTAPATAHAHG